MEEPKREREPAVRPRSQVRQAPWRHPIHAWHQGTRSLRSLPDVLIIGAQKSGTTSLYHYLAEHPRFLPAKTKEIHYFDRNYHRPLAWYQACFPLRARMALAERLHGEPSLTGEASPSYLFHPAVPERVAAFDLDPPLVAVLRDPVDRAYSHYQHVRDNGLEPKSFEEALEAEEKRLAGVTERLEADPTYRGDTFYLYSYRSRGRYLEQLERWLDHVDEDRLLILGSQRLSDEPEAVLNEVFEHVGLPPAEIDTSPRRNTRDYDEMDPDIRAELEAYYEPYNEELFDLLGRELDW